MPEQDSNEDRSRDIGKAREIGLELRATWLCRLVVMLGGTFWAWGSFARATI